MISYCHGTDVCLSVCLSVRLFLTLCIVALRVCVGVNVVYRRVPRRARTGNAYSLLQTLLP